MFQMSTNTRRALFFFIQIQKRLLTGGAPASFPPSPNSSSSFTVQFLINSCGLSSKSAISASQKLHLNGNSILKAQSVLHFFKSYYFEDTHIAKLIEKRPTALHCRIRGNMKPKFDFLIENGFAGELLPQLIVSNPQILTDSLDSRIKPSFQLLKSFLHSNDNVMVVIKRASWLLTEGAIVQLAIDFLIKEGMPVDRIQKFIIWQPRTILHKHDRIVYAVKSLKNLGLQPEDAMFTHALRVKLSLSESTWRKKIEVAKSFGWSEEEILDMFKRYPSTLAYSEKKIRSAMDLLTNTMGLERQIIINHPRLLGYSIEKRIRPRYDVIQVLESKELLIKVDKKIPSLLKISEQKFLENYITKYADKVPGLLEIYGSVGQVIKMTT